MEEAIMQSTTQTAPVSKQMLWAGRIISALPVLFLLFDSVIKLMKIGPVVESFAQIGFPEGLARAIGILELGCLVVYVIPRTSVLGAILLTGYLGGATAAKVRLEDPWSLFAVGVGVLVWAGLFLRDYGLRALVPLRS